jgi:hypothetical protein
MRSRILKIIGKKSAAKEPILNKEPVLKNGLSGLQDLLDKKIDKAIEDTVKSIKYPSDIETVKANFRKNLMALSKDADVTDYINAKGLSNNTYIKAAMNNFISGASDSIVGSSAANNAKSLRNDLKQGHNTLINTRRESIESSIKAKEIFEINNEQTTSKEDRKDLKEKAIMTIAASLRSHPDFNQIEMGISGIVLGARNNSIEDVLKNRNNYFNRVGELADLIKKGADANIVGDKEKADLMKKMWNEYPYAILHQKDIDHVFKDFNPNTVDAKLQKLSQDHINAILPLVKSGLLNGVISNVRTGYKTAASDLKGDFKIPLNNRELEGLNYHMDVAKQNNGKVTMTIDNAAVQSRINSIKDKNTVKTPQGTEKTFRKRSVKPSIPAVSNAQTVSAAKGTTIDSRKSKTNIQHIRKLEGGAKSRITTANVSTISKAQEVQKAAVVNLTESTPARSPLTRAGRAPMVIADNSLITKPADIVKEIGGNDPKIEAAPRPPVKRINNTNTFTTTTVNGNLLLHTPNTVRPKPNTVPKGTHAQPRAGETNAYAKQPIAPALGGGLAANANNNVVESESAKAIKLENFYNGITANYNDAAFSNSLTQKEKHLYEKANSYNDIKYAKYREADLPVKELALDLLVSGIAKEDIPVFDVLKHKILEDKVSQYNQKSEKPTWEQKVSREQRTPSITPRGPITPKDLLNPPLRISGRNN